MAPSPRRARRTRAARRTGAGLLAAAIALPLGAGAASAASSSPAAPTGAASTAAPAAPLTGNRDAGGLRLTRARTLARRSIAASRSVGDDPTTTTSLPASVDLRASGDVPPVGDQGSLGSCATWTIAHTMMGYYAARAGESGAPYSPLYLWAEQTGGTDPDAGTTALGDLAQARSRGVDTEADYWQGWYGYTQRPTAAEETTATEYAITGYQVLWQGVDQAAGAKQRLLEQALAAGNPVAVAFEVHSSFEQLSGLTSEAALDPESGADLGGHMVTAVGYDSTGLILRNQWGTQWGHGGDVKVTWAWVRSQLAEAYTISGVSSPADAGVRTPDAPAVVATSTSAGPLSGGVVVLTGSNLAAASAVHVGAAPAGFTRVSEEGSTRLVVSVPAATTTGTVPVTVTSAGGTSAASPAATWTYTGAEDTPSTTPSASPTASPTTPARWRLRRHR